MSMTASERTFPIDLSRTSRARKVPRNFEGIYEHLPGESSHSLYDATVTFAEKVDGRTRNTFWRGCQQLCSLLRREMVECCIGYVDADLYILDEFQRFRSLVDENSEEEQARLLEGFFGSGSRRECSCFPPPPFKAFTSDDDNERGEDHFKDLERVLEFLLKGEEPNLARYHEHRQQLNRQILDVSRGNLSSLSGRHRMRSKRFCAR